uniref:Ig-like domain-containing protein n=1 Tax=Cyprinodon variegatus TaxID=28743 RepID=A0A3Q2D5R3_CYPVA
FYWSPVKNSNSLLAEYLLNCLLFSHKNVHQEPPSMLEVSGNPATINCSHSISGYYVILWYQKPIGDSILKLIGYISNQSPKLEDEFKDHFILRGDGSKESGLHIEKLQPEDSSMYYCAASTQKQKSRTWSESGDGRECR